MELTLASAISADGLLGHLSYVALVLSMVMRDMTWLRLLVILSALLAIAYGLFILSDPVIVVWEVLLVAVNLVQLFLSHWRSIRAKFDAAEDEFRTMHLPRLTRGEARDLMDRGRWIDLPTGALLAVEGRAVTHLSYVAGGGADVILHGVRVSDCRPGDFVGEMTAMTGEAATATVKVRDPARVWQIAAEDLRAVVERRDVLSRELDAAFARNYRTKIGLMNRLVALGDVPS